MPKLSKLLFIYLFIIIYSFLSIYKPDIAVAATDSEVTLPVNSCQGILKGRVLKATLSREPAIDWPMTLTVDVATSVPHNPTFYGRIYLGSDSLSLSNPIGEAGYSGGISLKNLTSQTSDEGEFYRLVFPMPLMRLEGYRNIRLVYYASTKQELGCDFGRFYFGKAGGNELTDITCAVTVPDHIKYKTGDLIIKTAVTPVKEVFYKLYILKGDAGRLTRQIFDFATVPGDQAIDRSSFTRWTGIGANKSIDIINDIQEIHIPEVASLDMGEKISFVIEAREPVSFRGGTEDFGKYCALRTVDIWDKDSSKEIESSGAYLASGSAKVCEPNDINCTTSAGAKQDSCTNDDNNPGIYTAIGCIHTKPDVFVKDFMTFAIGIAGGLAFLIMLSGAFQMLTSAGNPDSLKAGQDRLTSAVIGLLFVIFAVLLLQIIGVDILHLPELGK